MKISKNNKQGFTLIELLVVISIISLLSSVVLAALNGARDKGRISAGVIFSTNVYQTSGADALAYWNFNVPGATASDISGNTANNNNWTLSPYGGGGGGGVKQSSDSPTGNGLSASFDGTIYFRTNSLSGYAGKSIGSYTLSSWIKKSSISSTGEGIIRMGGIGSTPVLLSLQNISGVNTIFCGPYDSANAVKFSFSPNFNSWQQITCSFDSVNKSSTVYIDGHLLSSVNLSSPSSSFAPSGNSIYAAVGGSDQGPGAYFTGSIDDAAIYGRALTSIEVQNLYASTLKTHQNLAEK